jgi:mycothiol synthase
MRPARTSDVPALLGLYLRWDIAAVGHEDSDETDVTQPWGSPGFTLEDRTRVLSDGGRPVGYGFVEPDGYTDVLVEPALWDSGLEDRLLDWAEQVPVTGRRTTYTPADAASTAARLTRRGWTPARTFWRMRRELDGPVPEPRWPAGVTVRGMDPDRDGPAVHLLVQTAFAEIGDEEPRTYASWASALLDPARFDPELYRLAERDGALVGACLGQDLAPDYGFVRQLAVDRPARGQGLGLALLTEQFERHAARGLPATVLGVDAGSRTGALALYERAGMHVAEEHVRWHGPS